MNDELLEVLAAFLVGIALGAFYFGSLWWVVRRVATLRRPELWLFVSFLARTAITLTGLFVVTEGRWERVAACMAGFLLARTAFVRRVRRPSTVIQTR